MRRRALLSATTSACLTATVLACGSESSQPPPTAAVNITIERAGNGEDPDGFAVVFGDSQYRLLGGETRSLEHVRAGQYTARLGNVAPHCFADQDSLRITVPAAGEATALFRVTCYGDFLYGQWYGPGDDQLFYFDSQGKSIKLTPRQPGGQWEPSWSPDGTRVVYTQANGEEEDIYVADLHGNVRAIAASPGRREWTPSWSPDGQWLAYTAPGRYYGTNVHLVRPDGTGDRVLLDTGERYDMYPVWAPDGSRIAFACWDGGSRICFVRPDGTDFSQTTSVFDNAQFLRWSPDGSRLAFQARFNGKQSIVLLRLDNWAAVDPAPDRVSFGESAWSPDGRRVLISVSDPPAFGLMVVNADGTGARIIAHDSRWGGAWSADGAKILFGGAAAQEVQVIDPDGSGRHGLVLTDASTLRALWRPGARPGAAAAPVATRR